MKIFISWSGERSRKVAQLLNTWLVDVIQSCKPWVSTEEIRHGANWQNKLLSELHESKRGIVCLTRENLNSPWILFEIGAMFKSIESKVSPLLIDLEPSEISDPIATFQYSRCNREGMAKLLYSLNDDLAEQGLDKERLDKSFEKNWPDFELGFNDILATTRDKEAPKAKTQEQILEEILEGIRSIRSSLSIEPVLTPGENPILHFYHQKRDKSSDYIHKPGYLIELLSHFMNSEEYKNRLSMIEKVDQND